MKKRTKLRLVFLGALLAAIFASGCTTVQHDNGATIKRSRDLNPMNYFYGQPGRAQRLSGSAA